MAQTALQTMKAIAFDHFGHPDVLHFVELPRPTVKPDEVLIQVAYAGVNPVDAKICEGKLKEFMPYNMPIIPGWDVSGKVVATGSNVTNLKVDDEVMAYCRKSSVQWGAYADFVTFHAAHTVRKPTRLSFAQAAVTPLAALTAWQALFDAAHLRRGQTVLIQAGAGGVGSFAVQFAKNAGACVLATAQTDKHNYLRQLGVDYPLDYREGNIADQVHKLVPGGVDLAIEMIGGHNQANTIKAIKPGGFLTTILEPFDLQAAAASDIYGCHLFVRPDGWQLQTIVNLIDKELIKPPHLEILPLSEAAEAHRKIMSGHTLGKIALKVSGEL